MKKKYIFLAATLTMILAVVAIYYVFPETAFKLLRQAERSRAGLTQTGIDLEGFHIEYLEDYKRLTDFIFVQKPFIPDPILNQLAKEAVRSRPLSQRIFKQLLEASNRADLENVLMEEI